MCMMSCLEEHITMSMVHMMDMDVPCASLVLIEEVTGSAITDSSLIVMNHCVGAENLIESSPRAESILKH